MIEIIQIPLLSDNYSYIIRDKNTNITGCIDPSVAKDIVNVLQNRGMDLNFILNTHHHHDHVGGNQELKEIYNCKIIGCYNDQNRIPGIDIKLKDNEEFNIGESVFKVIDTPGHTIGHICFYFKDQNFLFCGDTIFSLGCGRLFEGSYEQMTESILKIRSLPDSTKIFCGHEYTESNAKFAEFLDPENDLLKKKILNIKKDRLESKPTIPATLEEEKKLNPFMKFDNQEYLDSIKIENISNAENFKKIRIMKDNF